MTLIICPECGKEVSDKAEICVNCGFPLNRIKQNYINKHICIYKNEQYEITELVEYIKDHTFPGWDNKELNSDILSNARIILNKLIPNIIGLAGDELIYYIKFNRCAPVSEFIPTGNLPSSFGMAFIKAFVYGCFGLFKTLSLSPYSTIVPPYITATLSTI